MKPTVWLAVLLLLPFAAIADDAPPTPSEGALHFRVEFAGEKPRIVAGCFDAGKVHLDLDGDGKLEKTETLSKLTIGTTTGKKQITQLQFSVLHDERTWEVVFHDINAWRTEGEEPLPPQYMMAYTVIRGAAQAAFRGGGTVKLHGTADDARKEEPFRIGGKIAFEVSAGRRGPDALLNISVKDAGGLSLAQMRIRTKTIAPSFVLSEGGEEKQKGSAEYG